MSEGDVVSFDNIGVYKNSAMVAVAPVPLLEGDILTVKETLGGNPLPFFVYSVERAGQIIYPPELMAGAEN